MGWFNLVAGIASILGCLLTLWVSLRVRGIEKSFIRQAVLPEYLKKLRARLKNLDQYLKKKDTPKIRNVFIAIRPLLDNLHPHLDAGGQKHSANVIAHISEIVLRNDDSLWERCGLVIAELEGLGITIETQLLEMQWRSRDVN